MLLDISKYMKFAAVNTVIVLKIYFWNANPFIWTG